VQSAQRDGAQGLVHLMHADAGGVVEWGGVVSRGVATDKLGGLFGVT
jgi:hypothetical protein